jgi:hypothetical protein
MPPEDADAPPEVVRVEVLRAGEPEPASLSAGDFTLLVVPEGDAASDLPQLDTVVVGVDRADTRLAQVLTQLLNPGRATLELVHNAWLPPLVSSPTDGRGLDDPAPADIVAYDGAKAALLDTADDLRDAGFKVGTHLREERDAAAAVGQLVARYDPALVVLGRGKHGSGPGAAVLREPGVPVLYVPARG